MAGWYERLILIAGRAALRGIDWLTLGSVPAVVAVDGSGYSPAQQRLLDAATRLFVERGYVATSTRDLADELGIKGASLYSLFPDKEAILSAVVAPLLDAIDALLEHPPGSARTRHTWLTHYADVLLRHPRLVRIVAAELTVQPHGAVGQRVRAQDARVRNLLAREGSVNAVAGAGALGVLWWPLLCLPDPPPAATAEQLARLADRVTGR